MRRLMSGAAIAAIAVVAGCSALGKQAFQQPVVQLKDVAVQGVGLTGGNLAVKLNVYNPNGFRLDATRLTYARPLNRSSGNGTCGWRTAGSTA